MSPMGTLLYWVVLIGAFGLMFYFMAIRPQKKQQKKMDELMASLAIGDSVLTTAGFYGVVIDVMDEVIIVEFGNNKNCRIPMKKSSVVEVEKPMEEETKVK
ncbi:MAG: preprotein translocase subunit YajC [Lachnospiraceae bacterium]|nr:preprotein translocase subunit YajC [Lachnospiraceae bacterium]MBQ8845690.1 preprotein translocase subunit YajC [Lachnospiraceae bacterium]